MKKLFIGLSITVIFGGFLYPIFAKTTCKEVIFNNNITACINIEKKGTHKWNMITDIEGGSTTQLICDLMTPDSNLTSISECNGQFTYQGNKPGKIKIRIRYNTTSPIDREDKPNTNNEWTYPQRTYDFGKEKWINEYDPSFATSYSIITSPSIPNENERIDVTIKTNSPLYRGTIMFAVERKLGSSRVAASSSLYNLSQNTYTFTSTDRGKKTFENLIKFKDKNYIYRLVVYDNNNARIKSYKIFSLYDSNNEENNQYINNFLITTNTTTPEKNERVDLTIKARKGTKINTNYRGTIKFEIRHRELGYNNWTKTTSNNYYEIKTPYEYEGYKFTASDNGQITITNAIKFKKEGYEYKIIVKDKDIATIQGERIFRVKNIDEITNENFHITTDDPTPNTNQRIDLTIKARKGTEINTNYRGTIKFNVYYKPANTSSRIQTISPTYFEMKDNYLNNGYTFTTLNNGQKTFTNIIKFKKNNHDYKIVVYDQDNNNIQGYKIFTIRNDNDSNVNGFSNSQLHTIQTLYNARSDMINQLKTSYPKLNTNTKRKNMSDDLYQEMKKIINNDDNRKYENFNEFYDAFLDRYKYTISIR